MNLLYSSKLKASGERPRLLILSLLLSLLLHVLVVILAPLLQQEKPQTWQQQPTIVRLVDKPTETKKKQPEKPAEFEIDQQPSMPPPETPVESHRKADMDQKVKKELAPEGKDVRDQTAKPSRPVPPAKPIQKPVRKPARKQPQHPGQKKQPPVKKSIRKTAPTPLPETKTKPQLPPPVLSPEQLRPDFSTLDHIAQGSQAERNRIKERKDVEIGDTVWLDLQHNLLVSFFRRFHDKIELVWNYPAKAIMNGIEGTLELLIVVNRQGELLDVDLIQTSGSDLLDSEAILAVYRAAPFGALTKHYPHDKLKIRAHFSYEINGKYIYGL